MKLKLLVLAAMLAAGTAQAKIADSNDNGGSLGGDLYASLVSASNSATYTVDLGVTLDEFSAAVGATELGVKLVWDLDANTFQDLSTTIGGTDQGLAASMDTLNYGTVYTTFATASVIGATDLKFDVKAMDGLPASFPAAGANRYFSTSLASSLSQTNGQVFAMDNVDGYVTAANGDTTNSTHGTAFNTAGANMFNAGDATNVYFENGSKDNWNGATTFTSVGAANSALNFFYLTNTSSTAASLAAVTKYAGVWTFDAANAQLTYQSAALAAPVPEAETWAMLLAGLGMVGMIARRRKVA